MASAQLSALEQHGKTKSIKLWLTSSMRDYKWPLDRVLDLAKSPDAITHPDGMQIKITRQELGRIVGCSREMAGRVLKVLEEQALITAKGKTIVIFGTR